MMDFLPIFLALALFTVLSFLFSLWYARRLRRHAMLYDPLWYEEANDASKTTPLGYYSVQRGRRIYPAIRKEPRG
jgi:hypothetical protein